MTRSATVLTEAVEIKPQPGPQEHFLSSPADIVIYGGAAGGGKTWALLLEPLRHISNPNFGCVIFRRTFPEITNEGALWDEAMKIYPLFGAVPKIGNLSFTFPSGATVSFSHMQYEHDKFKWQGSQVALIGFDEVTHFSQSQFFYMLSRNRSMSGVRPYMRATTNPDAESWVSEFISWWIDEDSGFPIPERSGVIRWFIREGSTTIWADHPSDLKSRLIDMAVPKSVTFIPASVYDNRKLLSTDPGYLSNLAALPLVERERLLKGNWKIRPSSGKIFNREWFEIVESPPEAGGVECRFIDFAGTQQQIKGDDPDYTACVLMRKVGDTYYVLHCLAMRKSVADTEKTIRLLVRNDARRAEENGCRYMLRWEIEPGSAGIREAGRLMSLFPGLDRKGVPSKGDKILRARPLSSMAEMGFVKVVKGAWNEEWLAHMHHQPDIGHDDIMDASAGAFNVLEKPERRKPKSKRG